jgi:hypothetical protein
MRDGNTIQTITNGVICSTSAQDIERFETTNLDAEGVCVSEHASDHREQLVLDRAVIKSRQNSRQRGESSVNNGMSWRTET